MSRPEVDIDLSFDDGRKRRAGLTVADIERVTGEATAPRSTGPGLLSEASGSDNEPAAAPKAPKKTKAVKQVEGGSRMISFRLANNARAELERVSQLHSQPASFVIKKLIDQWMAKSPEKREEILTK